MERPRRPSARRARQGELAQPEASGFSATPPAAPRGRWPRAGALPPAEPSLFELGSAGPERAAGAPGVEQMTNDWIVKKLAGCVMCLKNNFFLLLQAWILGVTRAPELCELTPRILSYGCL